MSHDPELIGPKPPEKRLSFLATLRAMKDNPLATVPMIAYPRSFWEAKSIFGISSWSAIPPA